MWAEIIINRTTDLKAHSRTEEFTWKIPECPHTGCEFKCCKFDSWNYIVMYPWEMEEQISQGLKADHLETIDDNYLNQWWRKVVCHIPCTSADVKPLDCKVYPVFPNGKDKMISGKKCPLPDPAVLRHALITKAYVARLFSQRPELEDFFEKVEMVGYDELRLPKMEVMVLRWYLEKHKEEFMSKLREAMSQEGLDVVVNEEDVKQLLSELEEQEKGAIASILEINQ